MPNTQLCTWKTGGISEQRYIAPKNAHMQIKISIVLQYDGLNQIYLAFYLGQYHKPVTP